MAQSTVLNEFFNVISFKTDQASLNQAQNAIRGFKQFATKTLGALGIGLSLSWLRGITEEFSGINDQIRGTTEGLGEQAEIQKKILSSAQECRESYGKMAGYVGELVQKAPDLFPVDDAVKFTSLVEKLEKGSGKSGNISNTMTLLTKSLSSGKVDKSVFSQLEEKAPEVIKIIQDATGKSKTQLEAMAKAGTLSANTIKKAILSAEDDIQKKFDNVDLSITDAITHIRNSWGYWLEDIDSTHKLTDKISRAIITLSDKALGFAQKLKRGLDDIADKLGGYEKVLKFIAMAVAAVYIATHSESITKFLSGALSLLTKINVQTILAAAKWLALFLIIEDIWTFFKGGDSVIGRLLEDAGVDVDYLRETILSFFKNIKEFGGQTISKITEFWNEHKEQVKAVFDWIWSTVSAVLHLFFSLVVQISNLISAILTGDSTKIIESLKALWSEFLNSLDLLGRAVFGEVWDPMKESAQALWDWLTGFFDWIGEKISNLRKGWNNFKSALGFGGSSTDSGGFGGSSGKSISTGNKEKTGGSSGGTFGTSISPAWKSGTGVSPKTVASSQTSSTKNITVKQENNQQYTFKVDSTNAAEKLRNEANKQENSSAADLAKVINFGR